MERWSQEELKDVSKQLKAQESRLEKELAMSVAPVNERRSLEDQIMLAAAFRQGMDAFTRGLAPNHPFLSELYESVTRRGEVVVNQISSGDSAFQSEGSVFLSGRDDSVGYR